jgi:transcriptional regulator with XRE-family HTH domain
MNFYERIKECAKEKGASLNKVERELGYPRNSLSNYKLGQEPGTRRLAELSHYFGVSREYLLGSTDVKMSDEFSYLIEQLTENRKTEVLKFINGKLFEQSEEFMLMTQEGKETRRINVIEFESIGAGNWSQGCDSTMTVSLNQIPSSYDYAIHVNASQPPLVSEGDLIFIKFSEKNYNGKLDTIEIAGMSYIESIAGDNSVYFIRTFSEGSSRKQKIAEIVGLVRADKAVPA